MQNLCRPLLLFCLTGAYLPLQSIGQEQKIEAPIPSVIVYLAGAQLTHTKHLTLVPGRNELKFTGLSSKLIPRSIQFTASGDVSILAISNRIDYLSGQKKNDQRARQVSDSLIMMTDALSVTRGQIEAYEQEKQLLQNNQSIGGNDRGVAPADLRSVADFYLQRVTEINTELVKLRRKQTNQQEIVNKLNAQFYDYNQRINPPMGEISVLVVAGGSMKIETDIELRYVVSDCGWAPAYDLIAEDAGGPIELRYRAKVFNNTSVDWKDVKVKLSTANPMQSASAPHLEKWTLNYESPQSDLRARQPIQYQNMEPVSGRTEGTPQSLSSENLANKPGIAAPAGVSGNMQQQQQQQQQYSQIQISEFSAEFEIKQKYDIPADGKPYIVDVTRYNLKATYQHLAIPKLEKEAFLVARITGWEDLDLVEGPANVYFGGTYVGQSYILTRSLDDTLDLSLGRDKKLTVSRTKLKEMNSDRPTSTNKKETHSYEIVIRNNRKTPVQVELQDQIPVSQESEITVETQEISKGVVDPATGIITWNLNVPPGETVKVILT
ncbi:MAG TPA: DUF4139 domain-containing protein, partial [Bacteroidia bacterium]|nr:DUF4139 domain-containing protein [Bacteroidia bacterium]